MQFKVSQPGTNVILAVEATRYTVGPDVVTFYADGYIDGVAAEIAVAMFPKRVRIFSESVYTSEQLRAPMYNTSVNA